MGDDSKKAPERDCKEALGDGKEALGDGKEAQEKRIYDEVHEYLTKNTYSTSITKGEKLLCIEEPKTFKFWMEFSSILEEMQKSR